jgi:hypothetical protein
MLKYRIEVQHNIVMMNKQWLQAFRQRNTFLVAEQQFLSYGDAHTHRTYTIILNIDVN